MMSWPRNLRIIFPAQLLSIASFTFTLPFAPFYIQEMGVTDPARLRTLVALYAALAPLTLFLSSPFWGHMADRFGSKPMVIRSYLAAMIILVGMGFVQTPLQLLILRALQGLFTGTVTASQIMVVSTTPSNRSGAAFGVLSTAHYCGVMLGISSGGLISHHFGYRIPCMIAGGFQFIAFLLVLVGTKDIPRPEDKEADQTMTGFSYGRLFVASLPILVVMVILITLRRFDDVFVPLFIQELRGAKGDAVLWTGWMGATGALAGFLSGIILGRMADRLSPAIIALMSCLGAAIFLYTHSLLHSVGWLILIRALYTFGVGGLDTLMNIWLAKTAPEDRRGVVFGWSGSARALGMMFGPLAGGVVATELGLRPLFIIGAVLYIGMLLPLFLVMRKNAL